MKYRYDIVFAGVAIADCTLRGFNPEPVSAAGFVASSCTLCAGGEAVNGSVAAVRLGMNTGILCSVGSDSAGGMLESKLHEAGVDCAGVIRRDDVPTPITTIFLNADGTRKSITTEAHKYNFHPERYPEFLTAAPVLMLGSLFRAPFNDPSVILETVKAAKAAGIMVLADTKLPNFVRLTMEDIKEALPYIDYIFPNEDESKFYSGTGDPYEAAKIFLGYGIKNVIIKLGADGCLFMNQTETIRLPAYKVNAVDTTGSGDNFIAGFAAGLHAGYDHGRALRMGNACGALCATAYGASNGVENLEQVMSFLKTADPEHFA